MTERTLARILSVRALTEGLSLHLFVDEYEEEMNERFILLEKENIIYENTKSITRGATIFIETEDHLKKDSKILAIYSSKEKIIYQNTLQYS